MVRRQRTDETEVSCDFINRLFQKISEDALLHLKRAQWDTRHIWSSYLGRLLILPLNSVQASHPFREEACEMDGARCIYWRAGRINSACAQKLSPVICCLYMQMMIRRL